MKWKTLVFSSLYEVSENGQIRNKTTGKILTPYNNGRYLRVSLLVDKKSHKKWQASIKINGKKKHLGLFDDEDQAHEAYQSALLKLE